MPEPNRCALCPGKNACVSGDGPEDNKYRIIFIGEAPGKDEDKHKRPFVGKTGREVNEHYLPLSGLRRDSVRVTNAIQCMPASTGGKLDPKSNRDAELLQCCVSHHLYPELSRNRYKLIVTLGAFATRAIDPNIILELQHGIPVETEWGTVFPMYHPAQGIHEPKRMLHIRTDWTRLKKYMNSKLHIPKDEYAGIEDYQAVDSYGVREILRGNEDKVMANDTENTRHQDPYCLSFSIQPGTGYLIRAEDEEALQQFQCSLDKWRGKILWHNWMHDKKITDKMKLKYARKLIVDTMVISYHLGNTPQGLKALAYRELGMHMTDFEDVVKPHSSKLVVEYYREMLGEHEWPKPEPVLVRDSKTGTFKLYKAQSIGTKVRTFFTYLSKNPDKDVFKPWETWLKAASNLPDAVFDSDDEDEELNLGRLSWPEVEDRMGRKWPGMCISDAPFEEIIPYACRDSDSLLRVYPLLLHMRGRVRKTVQELWREGLRI